MATSSSKTTTPPGDSQLGTDAENTAFRTEVHHIKKGHRLFEYCNEACFKSKNLYNHANYLIRQQYFHLETFLPYDGKEDSLYYQVKNHDVYKALPAQTAQQTLRKLEDNWYSFFAAMGEWRINRFFKPGKTWTSGPDSSRLRLVYA